MEKIRSGSYCTTGHKSRFIPLALVLHSQVKVWVCQTEIQNCCQGQKLFHQFEVLRYEISSMNVEAAIHELAL